MQKNLYKRFMLILAICPSLLASSCPPKVPPAKLSWESVLKSCGSSDIHNSKPLYFGAANKNGVGSIWSYDSETKDYWPSSQLKVVTTRNDIVYENNKISCQGSAKNGIKFEGGIGLVPLLYPVTADVDVALQKATSVEVSVDSLVQEDAWWDSYNDELKKLPPDGAVWQGIELGNRLVLGRAWKVSGLKAILSFSGSNAVGVKATLDEKIAKGDLAVKVETTSEGKLVITSEEDVYVAGVFRKLTMAGLHSSEVKTIGDFIETPNNATAKPNRQ